MVATNEAEQIYNSGIEDLFKLRDDPNCTLTRAFFVLPVAIGCTRNPNATIDSLPSVLDLTHKELVAVKIFGDVLEDPFTALQENLQLHALILPLGDALKDLVRQPVRRTIFDGNHDQEANSRFNLALNLTAEIVNTVNQVDIPEDWGSTPKFDICATDEKFLDWLGENPDPDLWHLIVGNFNYDLPCTSRVLNWIVDQPDCDRATAASAFALCCGEDYAGRPKADVDERTDTYAGIVEKICRRSELGDGFPVNRLAPFGYDGNPRDLLDDMRRKAQSGDHVVPVPVKLLSAPFADGQPRTPYYVHSETIVSSGY